MGYPHSPQWRGGRFENPPDWPERVPFTKLVAWWFREGPRGNGGFVPPVIANDGQALRADRQTPSVTWIGHATMLVQAEGFTTLTDPMFSTWLGVNRRLAPPGLRPAHLPPIDLCIISHDHYDHLDLASVRALGPDVQFVVPLGIAAILRHHGVRRVVELDWWQSTTVRGRSGAHVEVTLVPAQHDGRRGLFDENRNLWGGFHLAQSRVSHYFAGDTGYPGEFVEIGKRFPGLDHVLLPIGAYGPYELMGPQHLGPEQAVKAFDDLGARHLVPMHWGTFRLTSEPLDEPPRLLRAAMAVAPERLRLLAIGETFWEKRP